MYTTPLAVQILGLEADPIPEGCGLPIGSYLSQWAGNVYLDGLDHHVKRELGVPAYLRYMDDFALFADDEASLVRARDAIGAWLLRERSLTLNPKRWDVFPTGASSIFLGYRVTRGGLAPSSKIRRRLATRVRLASEKGHDALVRCLVAYRGLLPRVERSNLVRLDDRACDLSRWRPQTNRSRRRGGAHPCVSLRAGTPRIRAAARGDAGCPASRGGSPRA